MEKANSVSPERAAELREKYEVEREKRLAARNPRDYLAIEAGSAFEADPFAPPPTERDAITDEIDVVILGGGLSGLATAAHLKRQGVTDFRIVDKAADFGGTWYWNRYPGLACDVEAYIYMPFLEELGYMPQRRYSPGSEILEHSRAIGRYFGLYEHALFQTRVQDVTWDEEAARWILTSDRGDAIRARYVVLAAGGLLHRPKLPAIEGIDTFAGKAFHTSRWDYGYTGGDQHSDLTGLADKRVAIIGTGATAIQVVPQVAKYAQHLFVFQRTPSIIDVRDNRPTDSQWWEQHRPGWQAERRESFEATMAGQPGAVDLIGDNWSKIWGIPPLDAGEGGVPDLVEFQKRIAEYDDEQMERIRARVDEIVEDPAVAEALKPYYTTHCKRPCFSDEYLPAFNRDNVTLVDTNGAGVDRISEHHIHFGDQAYEVDCIIYATGFEHAVSHARAGAFDIRGRAGQTLEEYWTEGTRSVHGLYTAGFPNLFTVGNLRQAAVAINAMFLNEAQAEHVAEWVAHLLDTNTRVFEVTEEAQDEWAAVVAKSSIYDESVLRSCTPGYFNNEGDLDGNWNPVFAETTGEGPIVYRELLRTLRASRELEDLATVVR
jgi:cyclohexanone monooxygenase